MGVSRFKRFLVLLGCFVYSFLAFNPISEAAEIITNSLGMKFVQIEPGTFMMGSPEDEPGRPSQETLRSVTLTQSFYMQTTEVTQGQWKAVMESNPSFFSSCGDDCPVEMVSWDAAQDFIAALNRQGEGVYRLPTEAEWEYAARAGTTTPFHTGDCLPADQANYRGDRPLEDCLLGEYRRKTLPVASFPPNAWGLYDMHGNVREWVQDWYENYPADAVTDPTGPSSGSIRVERGCSWLYSADECRSASRGAGRPGGASYDHGFRLVLLPGR